jgi:hypothetical protein
LISQSVSDNIISFGMRLADRRPSAERMVSRFSQRLEKAKSHQRFNRGFCDRGEVPGKKQTIVDEWLYRRNIGWEVLHV